MSINGFWDDERGCLDATHPERPLYPRLRQFWQWLTRSSATSGMRDMSAVMLIGLGLIRSIDGRLFATPSIEFAPAWLWGGLEVLFGLLLLSTRTCDQRVSGRGRLIASIACGFCAALAFAIFPTSASGGYIHLIIAYVLALEAQVGHECQ